MLAVVGFALLTGLQIAAARFGDRIGAHSGPPALGGGRGAGPVEI